MRLSILTMGLAVCLAAPINAASLPQSGSLKFDVIRKGKDIGDHSYKFSGTKNSYSVKVSTNVIVKVPLIKLTAYNFQHDSVETWKNGKLQKLWSTTNDDGTPHKVNSGASSILPASLWNEDIVKRKTLLNTVNGKKMSIRAADFGSESITTKKGTVSARHYRISGGLERDLWYDANGDLARVSFKADDGSVVIYVRN